MQYLEGTNPPQRQAITTTEGPLLVLAGAGTGKTRVLISRIAHILTQNLAELDEVLAVTFTNKAAREMQERLEAELESSVKGMWMGTFHSLSGRILREHAQLVGLDKDFDIVDPDGQASVMRDILLAHGIDEKQYTPKQMVGLLSAWKDNSWLPEEVPAEEAMKLGGHGHSVYRSYQERLKQLNACDFGDMMLLTLKIFKENPEILQQYQQQFKYILVDEYQDTNGVQYLWLRLLAMGHKNICVVGDDDQSIYGWRGAQVGNILAFEEHFEGAQTIRLEQNYRCTGNILHAANAVISHNEQRHAKELWTDSGQGVPVEVHQRWDDVDEVRGLMVTVINHHLKMGGSLKDIAVLVRSASQTRVLEAELRKAKIPHRLVKILAFHDRKEVKDAIAYLKLVTRPRDDLSFERVINLPKRGIGDSTLKQLKQISQTRNMPVFDAAVVAVNENLVNTKAKKALYEFTQLVNGWRSDIPNGSYDQLMEMILDESGYVDMLYEDKAKEGEEKMKERIDNVKELLRELTDVTQENLLDYFENLALDSDTIDLLGIPQDEVSIMTVHASKGLEFPMVFLPGFEDGLFPHQRSIDDELGTGVEEERRLAYVAMTRAKKKLIISHTSSRKLYGNWISCEPSRFFLELPEKGVRYYKEGRGSETNYIKEGHNPTGRTELKRKGPRKMGEAAPQTQLSDAQVDALNKGPMIGVSADGMSTGTKVMHEKLGAGRILGVEGFPPNRKFIVDFDEHGEKKMLESMANLQKI